MMTRKALVIWSTMETLRITYETTGERQGDLIYPISGVNEKVKIKYEKGTSRSLFFMILVSWPVYTTTPHTFFVLRTFIPRRRMLWPFSASGRVNGRSDSASSAFGVSITICGEGE